MTRGLLVLIVVAGIGIRLTYTLTTGHSQSLASRQGQVAHNIVANGRWFERNVKAEDYVLAIARHHRRLMDPASIDYKSLDKDAHWFPEINQSVGVSAVMAGLWSITGAETYLQIQILQAVIDGLMALLVYWIAMQLFSARRPAMIAAALYAIYPPVAWQTADPYDDIWAVDLTILIVALYLMVSRSDRRWGWLIACGLCAGLGSYFRPQVLLIVPVLALATVGDSGWREALRRGVVATIVALLMMVPWIVRNYNDFHAFILTRTAFWQTMWSGLGELPNSFGEDFAEGTLIARIHAVHPELVPESPAWDSYAKHYVIQAIERHPLFYLETLVHRVGTATVFIYDPSWMRRGAGHLHDYKGGLLASLLVHPSLALENALEPLVFLLALLGLGLTWRRWKKQHLLLIALVLCVLVPYIAVHVEGRYLLPAVVAYFIWIGLGADFVISHIARSRLTRATTARASRRRPW